VLILACCRLPVSFIFAVAADFTITSFKGTDGLVYFVCVFPSKISQEWPVNTAKKDPSWRALPWAFNKRENEELILDETQELFI